MVKVVELGNTTPLPLRLPTEREGQGRPRVVRVWRCGVGSDMCWRGSLAFGSRGVGSRPTPLGPGLAAGRQWRQRGRPTPKQSDRLERPDRRALCCHRICVANGALRRSPQPLRGALGEKSRPGPPRGGGVGWRPLESSRRRRGDAQCEASLLPAPQNTHRCVHRRCLGRRVCLLRVPRNPKGVGSGRWVRRVGPPPGVQALGGDSEVDLDGAGAPHTRHATRDV